MDSQKHARGLLKVEFSDKSDVSEESVFEKLSQFGAIVFVTILTSENTAYVKFELHDNGWYIDLKTYYVYLDTYKCILFILKSLA